MDNFIDKLAQKFSAQELIKANSQAEAAEAKRLEQQVAEYEKILQEMRKLNYKNTEIADRIEEIISGISEGGASAAAVQSDEELMAAIKALSEKFDALVEEEGEGEEGEMQRLTTVLRAVSEKMEGLIADNSEKIDSLKENDEHVINTIKSFIEDQDKDREAERERFDAERARLDAEREQFASERARYEQERIERERQAAEQSDNDAQEMSQLLDEKFKQSEDFFHKESVKVYRNVQAVVSDEMKRTNDTISVENTAIKSKLNAVFIISIISLAASLGGVILSVLTLFTAMGITLF